MNTRVTKPTKEAVTQAASLLRRGEVVAFPTETVYGLGGNALDADAVRRIFEAKGRPCDNPLIAHIARSEDLLPLISGKITEMAQAMMEAFWPGPLTMIFPKSPLVPYETTGGLETVAVRFPAHPVARRMILEAGIPIAAPSANRSGRPSPTTAAHVYEDMAGRIPLILDGGSCEVGVESTVVDMTGTGPRILRPGGITAEQIEALVGCCEVDSAVMRPLREGETARSPGMKYRHYAPEGTLTIFDGNPQAVIAEITRQYDAAVRAGRKPLILALDGHREAYGNRCVESLGGNAEEMARRIFAELRDADALRAEVILSEAVSEKGIGLAVMNRLGRAAAFRIVHVEG